MIRIEIYTDGSCNQTKKIGGWAFLVLEDGQLKFSGESSLEDTTSNQCEMIAAIKACELLSTREFFEDIHVTIYSDSAYMVNGFLKDWISKWLQNGWKNSEREPVVNKDLWESLIYYHKKYNINFEHIKRRSSLFSKMVDDKAKSSVVI